MSKKILIRASVILLVVVIVSLISFDVSISTISVCACPTVNELVLSRLNFVDEAIKSYRDENSGRVPSFIELESIIDDEFIRGSLTSEVDFSTRTFTFNPMAGDGRMIGYAASDSGDDYVLLGIGAVRANRDYSILGVVVWRERIGFDFPIFQPGDLIPEEYSPPA